jgi:hypothetical protein
MMLSEVYDALVAAGAPDDEARAAAIAVSEEQLVAKEDLSEIMYGLKILKWVLGIVIFVTVVPALKALFLP